MAELNVEIRARLEQVQRNILNLTKVMDGLEKEVQSTGKAVQTTGVQLDRMGATAEVATKKLSRLQRGGTNTSQVFFQAGQAISDFAVSGVLGAANNIEFLALQLGASGPIIAAVTAVTVSFLVFGDTIAEVLTGVSKDLDKLEGDAKRLADELIKVRDGLKITFEGTTEELEKDSERIQGIIEALEERERELRFRLGQQQTGTTGPVTTFVTEGPEIERLQEQLNLVLEVLRRQRGIQESINDTVAEQKLLREVINDLEGTSLTRKEEEEKKERQKLTLLERTIKRNNELRERLQGLRNIESSRLGLLLQQNKQLEAQIRIVTRLNQERARLGGGLGVPGLEEIGLGLSGEGAVTPIETLIKRLGGRGGQLRLGSFLSESVVADIERAAEVQQEALEGIVDGTDRTAEAFDRAGISARNFYLSTQQGALELGAAVGQLAGGIGDSFQAAYQASGESARGFFVAFKAFSIAEATISAFVAANKALAEGGPILGPILAASIFAQAIANVTRIASIEPGGGGVTGGASARSQGARGFVDPRDARDGRFRRNLDGFDRVGGFGEPFPIGDLSNVRFFVSGEDLVGAFDRNVRRQDRTRGLSREPTRSNTRRGGR